MHTTVLIHMNGSNYEAMGKYVFNTENMKQ